MLHTHKCKIDAASGYALKNAQLPDIIDSIVDSCHDPETFRHIDFEPIPSRENIVRLVHGLMALLFPGYFSRKRMDPVNLKYETGQSVAALYDQLAAEIILSIRHECFRYDADCTDCVRQGHRIALDFFAWIPELKRLLAMDVKVTFDGDPAAKTHDEIIFSYPGFFAIAVYRMAHCLFQLDTPLIPRIMSEYAHSRTGIDIHPGATIGKRFAIDHGTGVVIGETTVVGENVRIYQGVTLGALSLPENCGERYKGKKRHPTIEDNVIVYSGATILGGQTVIGSGSIIGGNVWVTRSVPPDTTLVIEEPRLIYRHGEDSKNTCIEPEFSSEGGLP